MSGILEVIGKSPASFSEAVKDAINQMLASGEKILSFKMVEQKELTGKNKLGEFQIKLQVSVESDKGKAASDVKTESVCPTCSLPITKDGHLCIPRNKENKKCFFCDAVIVNERHMCKDKIKELTYFCENCERLAVKPEYVCKPKRIS